MRARNLRDLTDQELEAKEEDLKRKLFNLRFQVATDQQDNTALIAETRKDIARVKTILRERELEAEQMEEI